jgi:Fur family peroxide stress response transcriptional regulator
MAVPAKETERRVACFIEVCRRSGRKVTHQRLEVFREVAGTDEHPDVETVYSRLHKRLPTVSVDTVYRTLGLLRDLGLVDALTTSLPRMRFDGNPTPHHHFICSTCGEVCDFYSEEFDQLQVPREVRAHGTVQKTQVEMRGTCLRCARAKNPKRVTGATGRRPWGRD